MRAAAQPERRRTRLLPALVLTVAACGCQPPPDLVVVDTAVVDVEAGVVRPRQTIRIRDGRIVTVGPLEAAADGPAAARSLVVDGRGRYAIPGLWDMHVHELLVEAGLEPRDAPPPAFWASARGSGRCEPGRPPTWCCSTATRWRRSATCGGSRQ